MKKFNKWLELKEDVFDGRVYYGNDEEYDTVTKRPRAYHKSDEDKIEQALEQKLTPEINNLVKKTIIDFERNELPKLGLEPKTTMHRPEVVIRSMTKKAVGYILVDLGNKLIGREVAG
jgi:hypothetical protein